MDKIKLAIADDHHLFRKGMISLLQDQNLFSIVLEAENGKTLLEALKLIEVDVLLLDLRMPVISGDEALDIIKFCFPSIKILVLTMHDDDVTIKTMIGKGANGFLMKDDSLEAVIEGINTVYSKDYYFTPRVLNVIEKAAEKESRTPKTIEQIEFTKRELEILQLICHEFSTKEIASKLKSAERTVDWHRKNIIEKTKSKNTAGIVYYAVKNLLVD
ncbi:MAG: response regulator transcription factor [Bacteroidetes bacterium]|nr:response regulator transcription factor [Bacteroidota bacterium]